MSQNDRSSPAELAVWVLAILCLTAVMLSPVACTINRQDQVAAAIKAGADPIAAKCAIEGDTSRDPVCIAHAAAARPK